MSSVTSNTSLEQTVHVIVLCFLVLLSLAAAADTLTGKVVKITDGDTIYVLDANYEQHKTYANRLLTQTVGRPACLPKMCMALARASIAVVELLDQNGFRHLSREGSHS
jgi:hypothetical protein